MNQAINILFELLYYIFDMTQKLLILFLL